MLFSDEEITLTVPSRTKRPVADVTGRAVAAVRAVFKTFSMLLPPCMDWVFRRTIPVMGRPDMVIGLSSRERVRVCGGDTSMLALPQAYLIAGLGPFVPPVGFAVGCRIDVPGKGA